MEIGPITQASGQSIFSLCWHQKQHRKTMEIGPISQKLGWRQDNGNRSNQQSKVGFLINWVVPTEREKGLAETG